LPRPTEHSEEPSTLPAPELNPLLNPLLAQNMGRWAEVYFTSPPEKREQAVMDLLRELEAGNSTRAEEFDAPSLAMTAGTSEPAPPPDPRAAQVEPVLVRCLSCGRELPSSQKYCGMCGARQERGAGAADGFADRPLADPQVEDSTRDEPAQYVSQEPQYVVSEPTVHEPAANTNELSLFQNGRNTYGSDDNAKELFTYPAPSRSYRLYVGIALAIVILALGYMAWRSAQATSETSHVAPPAPPVAATEGPRTAATPASSPSSSPKTEAPDQAGPAQEQATTPPREAPVPASEKAGSRVPRDMSPEAPEATAPIAVNPPPPQVMAGKGAEELETAQSYLSGTNGQPRNSAEAAKWLWKSMAKHNATATLLLANLYLKGDGVSKNCDQARVLLDSAARAGVKDAGERLRHLQAFGCD